MKTLLTFAALTLLLMGCTSQPKTSTTKKALATNEKLDRIEDISVRSRFLDNGQTLRVYLQIEVERFKTESNVWGDFSKNFNISYSISPDYTNAKSIVGSSNVVISEKNVTLLPNKEVLVSFDIQKPKDVFTAVVFSQIKDGQSNTNFVNDLFVRFQSGKVSDYFGVFDKTGKTPHLRNYFDATDSIILKDLAGTSRKMTVLRYKHDFDPAQPPTATSPRVVTKSLFLDSLYTIETNKPFALVEEGLFYICRDTTESYGIGLMGVDNRYPKLTRPEKLTKPLIYMSTPQEIIDWGKATTNEEAKKALDRFFLVIANGNQATAKRTIKAYYRRIEEANKRYTTYKEGWKTDKGMVYVIMGQPDRTAKSKDKEIWTYAHKGQFSDVNFTFSRRSNQFVEEHYELARFAEYQPIWFPVVEAWRVGEVAK